MSEDEKMAEKEPDRAERAGDTAEESRPAGERKSLLEKTKDKNRRLLSQARDENQDLMKEARDRLTGD